MQLRQGEDVQRLLATYAHFMSSGVKIPHHLDVPVPVMQTAAAPTNPHHSTYFGTTPNHENKWDSRMDPKWCGSKIPLSLTPSQLIVKPDPSNSECKLPHSEADSDAAFVRDGSPCSHSIPQPWLHGERVSQGELWPGLIAVELPWWTEYLP